MKKFALAASAVLGLASVAAADVKIDFADMFGVAGGGSQIIVTTPLQGTLTGFSINFDYTTNAGGSWASDAALVIDGVQTGGYDIFLSTGSIFNDYWSFDGPGSAASGNYGETVALGGVYNGNSATLEFGNGYSISDPVDYTNITVTLHGVDKIPAPGAVALLGVAGLMARRRRA